MKMEIELYLPPVTISLEDIDRVRPMSHHLKTLEQLPLAHEDVVKRTIKVDRDFWHIKGYEVMDYAKEHLHRGTRYLTTKELDDISHF